MGNWLANINGVSTKIPIYKMENTHLQKAYWWACKRYTIYHNETCKEDYKNDETRHILYYKLREMELVANSRDIKLTVPPIQLIKNDRNTYWKCRNMLSVVD